MYNVAKDSKNLCVFIVLILIISIFGGFQMTSFATETAANSAVGEDQKLYYKGSTDTISTSGGTLTIATGGITYSNGATLSTDWRATLTCTKDVEGSVQMRINVIQAGDYTIELGNMHPLTTPINVSVNGSTPVSKATLQTASGSVRWDNVGKYTLSSGINTIKIANTAGGYLRMDTIALSQSSATPTPTPSNTLAQSEADSITLLYQPIRDTAKLVLPTINSAYTAEIYSTNPSGIIAADGTITRPASDTNVKLQLKITNNTNANDTAFTKDLNVLVTKQYTTPLGGNIALAKDQYGRKKTGFFVHYVPHFTSGYNGTINDIDELANTLNVEQFANDMEAFGVEYVVFTAWHARMLPLFPSEASKRWRDDRRKIPQNKTYSDRDVIGDLITALKAKNIDLHLYIHPTDGHDFLDRGTGDNILQDQTLTGFNNSAGNYEIWNTYVNELVDEMCKRYGTGIKGVWIDGVSSKIQYTRLNKTLRAYNPNMIIIENSGSGRQMTFPTSGLGDFFGWEVNSINSTGLALNSLNANAKPDDAKTWPGGVNQIAFVVGDGWWSKDTTSEFPPADNQNDSRYTAKNMFLYNVLLASVSKAGGLLFATGCGNGVGSNYIGGDIWGGGKEGGGNIYATIKDVNNLIKPIEESIRNTNIGKAYVTTSGSWLDQYDWGVSTESLDRKYVYLHVVKPPQGKKLSITKTADGSILGGTATYLNTNTQVAFVKTVTGYDITIPDNVNWDSIDTVIKVERISEAPIATAVPIAMPVGFDFDNEIVPSNLWGFSKIGTGFDVVQATDSTDSSNQVLQFKGGNQTNYRGYSVFNIPATDKMKQFNIDFDIYAPLTSSGDTFVRFADSNSTDIFSLYLRESSDVTNIKGKTMRYGLNTTLANPISATGSAKFTTTAETGDVGANGVWYHIVSKVDFNTKKQSLSIFNKSTGAKIVDLREQDIKNSTNLSKLLIGYGYNTTIYPGVYLDNFIITTGAINTPILINSFSLLNGVIYADLLNISTENITNAKVFIACYDSNGIMNYVKNNTISINASSKLNFVDNISVNTEVKTLRIFIFKDNYTLTPVAYNNYIRQ